MFYLQENFGQDERELWTMEEAIEALSQIRTLVSDEELTRVHKNASQH